MTSHLELQHKEIVKGTIELLSKVILSVVKDDVFCPASNFVSYYNHICDTYRLKTMRAKILTGHAFAMISSNSLNNVTI